MTGDLLLDLMISFAGVAVLVGVAFLLGATRTATVDRDAAAERLAFDEPDFAAGDWLLDRDGRCAIALAVDGDEYAVVFAVGDSLGTRRLRKGARAVTTLGDRLVLALGDVSKRRVVVRAADDDEARRWAVRLAAAALSSAHGLS